MINKELAKYFKKIARLLEIKGEKQIFRIRAYQKAAQILENITDDIGVVYKQKGIKGIEEIAGLGKKSAQKIEEYIKTGKIKILEELEKETAIKQVITHFFESKGLDLKELKENAKKRKIIYSRYTKPAKQLIELAGGVKQAQKAIDIVAQWADSRGLDYAIETVFKKWLELDRLKPKEIVKKPFYQGMPMIFSQTKNKWYVINEQGEWLEFADKEDKIEWRTIK